MSNVIYNSETGQAETWYPSGYIVSGHRGESSHPRYVLDVVNEPPPPFDPATEVLEPVNTADLEVETYTMGWTVRPLTAEEIEARKPKPGPTTKLTIMRRLGARWPILKAALTTLPEEAQDAWQLAQEISPTDPLIETYSPALKSILDLTDEEFSNLFLP
jgi:hypothetical protein